MDKATIFYMILEFVIMCIPVGTLAVKLGRVLQRVATLEEKINNYNGIDNRLTAIETKIDLLLDGKVKTNG
jgi:hypothetical protein